MERLSTLVIQKLLDGFFLGLDVVDGARRRIDRVMGRPEEEPFEVVWPEPEQPVPSAAAEPVDRAAAGEAGTDAPEPAVAKPKAAKPKAAKAKAAKPKATKPKAAKPKASAGKGPNGRPKVPMEIDDLAEQIKSGKLSIKPLSPEDELAGKRMVARIVYVLGAAETADLGALSSTEIAHVLTFAHDIETFGTNISRAIRQGTKDLVEARTGKPKEINRYALTDAGREAFASQYGKA